jgi:flagellar biosynthesis protein FliP
VFDPLSKATTLVKFYPFPNTKLTYNLAHYKEALKIAKQPKSDDMKLSAEILAMLILICLYIGRLVLTTHFSKIKHVLFKLMYTDGNFLSRGGIINISCKQVVLFC